MSTTANEQPRTKPPARAGDIAVTVILLVVTAGVWVVFGITEFFMLAFTDHCPPERCSIDGATSAVVLAIVGGAAVALLGGVISVVQLVRRKSAWPIATATLVLCTVALVAGGVGYFAAVG